MTEGGGRGVVVMVDGGGGEGWLGLGGCWLVGCPEWQVTVFPLGADCLALAAGVAGRR